VAGPVPSGLPAGSTVSAVSRYPDGTALDLWVRAEDGNVYTAFYNDAAGSWNGWHRVAQPAPDL
jgi:hypothetical protein